MTGAAELAIRAVRARARPGRLAATGVDVHFHPDAPAEEGNVLASIASAGRWRTQFETGTSNGGLTAHPGGDRWRWESRLFDGAYDGSPPEARPVYGALRRVEDPYGSAPRFGSAYLRVGRGVLDRTTLCYPDSAHEPEAVGVVDAAGAVLDALRLIDLDDPLDRYVEAHVHRGLRLADVEAVVLDPSHRGTEVEAVTDALGAPVEWHRGYLVRVDDLRRHEDYRGAAPLRAAERIAVHGVLTPALIGRARRSGEFDAAVLKRVWHLLARFGR